MLLVTCWWRGGHWSSEEAVAYGEVEAACCHTGDHGLGGRQPMVAMMAFVSAGASAVEDVSVRSQPRGLLLFPGSATITLPTNRQTRTIVSISLGF